MSPPGLAFESRPEGSGGEQNAGRGSRGARPDRDRLKQARTHQLARLACEIDQRRRGELVTEPARGARRDHGASEPGALERRVNRPKQLAERPLGSDRIVRHERVAETIERRRDELRQHRVKGEIELGQLRQLAEQLLELTTRNVAKLPRRPPRGVSEEGAREALLRGTAPDAAAALCLTTAPTGTRLVATDLRHGFDRGASTGRKADRLPAELTNGSTSVTNFHACSTTTWIATPSATPSAVERATVQLRPLTADEIRKVAGGITAKSLKNLANGQRHARRRQAVAGRRARDDVRQERQDRRVGARQAFGENSAGVDRRVEERPPPPIHHGARFGGVRASYPDETR
jgi:hypothetical protein